MSEQWRPIAGYEGIYEVSDQGRVRSLDRTLSDGHRRQGQLLKPRAKRSGHLFVSLCWARAEKQEMVHRLVASAFVPNPDLYPLVLHWNDVPDDNRAENLRWGTDSQNRLDAVRNGVHGSSRKGRCPRLHPLEGSNLVGANAREGRRNCRACNIARSHARYHGIDFTKELADEFYRRIIDERSAA